MDFQSQIGRMDRTRFTTAHNDTVLAQGIFEPAAMRDFMAVLAYEPCWAMLNPGMTLEAHHHPNPEFYVFVSGDGRMTLNDESFEVHNGMAVNIPPDVVHQVANSTSAIQPLIWISVALKV